MRALVAWREGLFLTEGKIGVLSVSSLFILYDAGGSVRVRVCVYTHTHTHTAQMGYLDVRPGVGMRHLEGPKNPDGLSLDTQIFVYVYKVHMCVYTLRGGMTNCFFSLTYFSFPKRKAKDVHANYRSSQILIPRFKHTDPQSRVLNYFL